MGISGWGEAPHDRTFAQSTRARHDSRQTCWSVRCDTTFSNQQPRQTRMLSVQIARCLPCRVPHTPQHPMCQRHRTFLAYRPKSRLSPSGTPSVRQLLPKTGVTYGAGIAGCIRL